MQSDDVRRRATASLARRTRIVYCITAAMFALTGVAFAGRFVGIGSPEVTITLGVAFLLLSVWFAWNASRQGRKPKAN